MPRELDARRAIGGERPGDFTKIDLLGEGEVCESVDDGDSLVGRNFLGRSGLGLLRG